MGKTREINSGENGESWEVGEDGKKQGIRKMSSTP